MTPLIEQPDGTYRSKGNTTIFVKSDGYIIPKIFLFYTLVPIQGELSRYRRLERNDPNGNKYRKGYIAWLEVREARLVHKQKCKQAYKLIRNVP